MNRYFLLTKVMLKNINLNLSMSGLKDKKNLKNMALVALIVVCMLPMATGIGAAIFSAYDILAQIQQEGVVLSIGLSAASLAIFFFGIFYIINVFYFSRDIESLLPLPLRPLEILGAKFTIALIYEYLTELLLLAPIMLAYGIKSHGGIFYYLFSIIVFLILPVAPLVYASIISMIIMQFTNIGKNKDRFKIVGGVVAMFLALGINMFVQRFMGSSMNPQQLQQLIAQGNNSLLNTMGQFFPQNKYAVLAMIYNSEVRGIMNLILYLAIVAAFIMIFLYVGEMLYFKGVVGISESSAKRKKLSAEAYNKAVIQKPVLLAFIRRELNILFRTPAYFMNCILMNFLWPVFIIVPLIAQPKAFEDIKSLSLHITDTKFAGILLASAFSIGLFVSASNLITATAISREGRNIYISKYLPVKYGTQIVAKVISGVMMGIVGVAMMLLAACVFVAIPLHLLIMILLTSLLGICFSSLTGILIDLFFPKLLWDDETKAVKQNMNGVINIFLCTAVAAGTVILTVVLKLNLWTVFAAVILAFGLLDAALYIMLTKIGPKCLGKIEI